MDTAKEWQRLQAHYASMGDQELMELRDEFGSLTDTAQSVLRDELRRRKLREPDSAERPATDFSRRGGWEQIRRLDTLSGSEAGDTARENEGEPESMPSDYTWKAVLREFASPEEAWMANEALKDAGIESYLQVPRSALDATAPRVLVPADTLDEAAAVLAKPIPEEIRAAALAKIDDFVPPHCPRCGAEDPLLESADPANQWSCEGCGHAWQDEIPLPR